MRRSHPPRQTVAPFALPVGALALGVGALLAARQGAGHRPALVVATIAAGAIAGLLPFRYALPLAITLACFQGFLTDFAGPKALYWNEAFALVVVARSLVQRRPSRRELVAAGLVLVVFSTYLLTGTSLRADFWGGKVLATSAIVGWALARLDIGPREWRAMYYGLATVAGASLVLGAWQRAEGVSGLQKLGLVYGQRIREVSGGGAVRAFGGFTSPAPLSYMLAIAVCAWAALVLGRPTERRLAFGTAWVPIVALVGIVLAVDRTAIVASLAAFAALTLSTRRRVLLPALTVGAVAVVALLFVSTLGRGLGSTARARLALWGEYLADFKPLGEGPATAGSAYDKVAPQGWIAPLTVPHDWDVTFRRILVPSETETSVGTRLRPRPAIALSVGARSLQTKRRLIVGLRPGPGSARRPLTEQTIPRGRSVRVRVRVPPGDSRSAPLQISALPAQRRTSRRGLARYRGRLVNLVRNPSVEADRQGWSGNAAVVKSPTITRDTHVSRFGSSSLKVANALEATHFRPRSGVIYAPIHTKEGATYAVSAYVRGAVGGELLELFAVDSLGHAGNVTRAAPAIRLTRAWRRYSLAFRWPSATPALTILFQPEPIDPDQPGRRVTFFVDGLQVEPGRNVTDYCDGSIEHCRWAGRRNASRSLRAGSTTLISPTAAGTRAPGFVRVRSTGAPMPSRTPFRIAIGKDELEVRRIVDLRTYRTAPVKRRSALTVHPSGEAVWAVFPPPPARPKARPPAKPLEGPALALTHLRIDGLPRPRTPAERIWQRWFDDTPAALNGDGPGLVDDLYVSWIFQYGLLGIVLCVLWFGVLLRPAFRQERDFRNVAGMLVGIVLVVSGAAVSVWEEAPTDLLAALVLSFVFAARPAPAPEPANRETPSATPPPR